MTFTNLQNKIIDYLIEGSRTWHDLIQVIYGDNPKPEWIDNFNNQIEGLINGGITEEESNPITPNLYIAESKIKEILVDRILSVLQKRDRVGRKAIARQVTINSNYGKVYKLLDEYAGEKWGFGVIGGVKHFWSLPDADKSTIIKLLEDGPMREVGILKEFECQAPASYIKNLLLNLVKVNDIFKCTYQGHTMYCVLDNIQQKIVSIMQSPGDKRFTKTDIYRRLPDEIKQSDFEVALRQLENIGIVSSTPNEGKGLIVYSLIKYNGAKDKGIPDPPQLKEYILNELFQSPKHINDLLLDLEYANIPEQSKGQTNLEKCLSDLNFNDRIFFNEEKWHLCEEEFESRVRDYILERVTKSKKRVEDIKKLGTYHTFPEKFDRILDSMLGTEIFEHVTEMSIYLSDKPQDITIEDKIFNYFYHNECLDPPGLYSLLQRSYTSLGEGHGTILYCLRQLEKQGKITQTKLPDVYTLPNSMKESLPENNQSWLTLEDTDRILFTLISIYTAFTYGDKNSIDQSIRECGRLIDDLNLFKE